MLLAVTTTSGLGTVTPNGASSSITAIELALNDPLQNGGITYNPTATPALREMIVITVSDSLGASDTVNLREFTGISSENIQHLIFTAQTAQANGLTGNDTLLTLDDASHTNLFARW